MKKCLKCNQLKEMYLFYESKTSKDKRITTCIECYKLVSNARKERKKESLIYAF